MYIKRSKYITKMLEKYNKNYLNPVSTPVKLSLKLNKNKE